MFHSYLLYVGAKKKIQSISLKKLLKEQKMVSQMGIFVPLPFKNFIKNQFTFYQNPIYVLQMRGFILLCCSPTYRSY